MLIRSEEPADLREASRQLHAAWSATIERIRRTPGIERRSVNDEWSAVQAWLEEVTAEQLAARAPVPDDDVWPP